MKVFRRASSTPERRQVSQAGRPQAYSYYARRSDEPTAVGRQMLRSAIDTRHAKRAARYWRQRFGLLLVVVAVFVGAINLLALTPDPTLKAVDTSEAELLHPLSAYQHEAGQLLGDSVLNRNKITIDTVGVIRGLEHQFPELSSATVVLPIFGHKPIIYITQASPALLLTASGGQTYIVASNGRAVATTDKATAASLQLLAVRDDSGQAIKLGQLVLPASTVSFIQDLHFQLAQRQVHADSFVLPAGTSEVDVYLPGQKYFIKCNLASNNVLQQAGSFLAVQQYFEEKGITPGQYVDVRLDGRVYYK